MRGCGSIAWHLPNFPNLFVNAREIVPMFAPTSITVSPFFIRVLKNLSSCILSSGFIHNEDVSADGWNLNKYPFRLKVIAVEIPEVIRTLDKINLNGLSCCRMIFQYLIMVFCKINLDTPIFYSSIEKILIQFNIYGQFKQISWWNVTRFLDILNVQTINYF